MIKLRLQRKGRKKRPFYHIVVADSRSPRDGRIIEKLGRFDNVSEHKELTYDEERVIHWLKIGAQPSNTVRNILKDEGILYKMHLLRWGKSDEEIEAALTEWREAKEAKAADKDTSRKAQQKELLKAEEKEYKQQVEEKAAKAAEDLEREKKLKEAEATAEESVEETAQVEEAVAEDSNEDVEAETPVAEAEENKAVAEEETTAEDNVQPEEASAKEAAEVVEENVAEATEEPATEEVEAKEETEEEQEASASDEDEDKEEAKAEAESEESEEDEEDEKTEAATVSTDMNANEAIDHIKNNPLEELEGFVPEEEDRVTVQRAWESKQSDSE